MGPDRTSSGQVGVRGGPIVGVRVGAVQAVGHVVAQMNARDRALTEV